MQIEREAVDRLKVGLTGEELMRFRLTYEQLDYQNRRTRLMLQTVLSGAAHAAGFLQGRKKLMIEVFPAPGRGCTIYYTALPRAGKRFRLCPPRLYRFDCCEDLLRGCAGLPPVCRTRESRLYRWGDAYYLLLPALPGVRLAEFSCRMDATPLLLARLNEHADLLAAPDAVAKLQTP